MSDRIQHMDNGHVYIRSPSIHKLLRPTGGCCRFNGGVVAARTMAAGMLAQVRAVRTPCATSTASGASDIEKQCKIKWIGHLTDKFAGELGGGKLDDYDSGVIGFGG